MTPFYAACQFGHKEVASLLLADPRIFPNKEIDSKATPFRAACEYGDTELVSLLLADKRIDPDSPITDGTTPLFVACKAGNTELVSLLLADGRIDPTKTDNEGATPLWHAANNGCKEVVSLLVADRRVDPNKPKKTLATPLWAASNNGHLVIAQYLLTSERMIDTGRVCTWNNRTAGQQGRAMSSRSQKGGESLKDHNRIVNHGPQIADLIEAYEKAPGEVRFQLRQQVGIPCWWPPHSSSCVCQTLTHTTHVFFF